MDYLYGKLNNEVKYREYKGSETNTASVTIDDSDTVSVDVKKVPNELTLTTINGDTYTYDGSEPASFDIRTQVTDKVEEGNNLPVTSDAVKGYVDSKAGALEYVGGEGNFTNINGGVTVKGRLNVDNGIYSPVTSDDPNFVPNNKSVDDKITASEQKLIDERIGAFTRTEDKLFTDVEGGMTIKGHLNVDGGITSPTEPTSSTDVANKGYVDDNFVPKHIPAVTKSAYTTDTTGEQSLMTIHGGSAEPFSIAARSAGGVVRVGTPVADNDATTKKYVDDGFVKSVAGTPGNAVVYVRGVDGTDKTASLERLTISDFSVVQRSEGGVVRVGAPVDVADATTKKYVDDADAKKVNLTGGTITGSLAIQGDLTVTGTTTTEKAQTLAVKDSVIVTNADGAELGSTLSGIAIRKDGENTYGVMYDPSGDSVKLGLGTLDAENKFTFNESGTDGKAIATRADSSALTDGDLVKWDGTTNSLVDSGKKTDDFVEKVTVTEGSNLAYIAKNDGTQSTVPIAQMPYQNTVAQRGAGGTLKVGTAVSDSDAMPKKQVEDGFVPKSEGIVGQTRVYTVRRDNNGSFQETVYVDSGTTKWSIAQRDANGNIKVGTPRGVNDATTKKYVDDGFVAKVTPSNNLTYVYSRDGNGDKSLQATSSMNGNTVAYRDANGNIGVGTPTEDAHSTTKKYVDDADSKKVNLIDGLTAGAVVYATETANGTTIGIPYSANTPDSDSIVQRQQNGVIVVGTPTSDATDAAVNIKYANANYVAKVTTKNIAYTTDNNGNAITTHMSFNPTKWDLATFDGFACLRTSDPTGDDGRQCVNKQYADAHYVKSVAGTTHTPVAYIRGEDGTDKTVAIVHDINNSVTGDFTIAQRGKGGILEVGTPVGVNDATTKAYVDNLNAITITAGA